jgi:hypothetical protein
LFIVHVKTYVPAADTETKDEPVLTPLKEDVPGPDVCVHVPIPTVGVLPPRPALTSEPQIFCVLPAMAVVGFALNVTVTDDVLGVQVPLAIVHV